MARDPLFRCMRILLMGLTLILGLVSSRADGITVVLLGTGGPELTRGRQGAATLIEAGGHRLLFDTGRGVLQRLYEARVDPAKVTEVFFTHLHSDHIEGLPSLWMTGWFLLGRTEPMAFYGPDGTEAMLRGMEGFLGHDLVARVHSPVRPPGLTYAVHEIKADGVCFDRDGLVVTAFLVDHKDGNPAFGYRIDYQGHAVVLSGDCTYSQNLIAHAQKVDLLVHNVFAVSDEILMHNPGERAVALKLAPPELVASVFAETRPKLAALSHVIRIGLKDEEVVARIRASGYKGPLLMGLDRTVIRVGDTVIVEQPASLDHLPDAAKPGDVGDGSGKLPI